MKNPFKRLTDTFSLEAVVEAGFEKGGKKPALSDRKREELMAASSLDTPRSTMQSMMGILKPYWTESGPKEIATASALLATSLFMTWYAVQVTVDFGNWQSGLMNTIQQLFQTMMTDRADMVGDVLGNYDLLKDTITNNPQLNEILMRYPDTTSIMQNPEFRELLSANPELAELMGKNPTMEDVFMNFPGIREQVANNPEILDQLRGFDSHLSERIFERPAIKQHLSNLATLCGGDFINNWGTALKSTFNSVSGAMQQGGDLLNEASRKAVETAWKSKDLATIALKFTAMAIVSYKSSQYLALRWRGWSTGYYANKWLNSKAYMKIKDRFNNIDNPGQRIQEDPAKFTAGAVSLLTGVTNSGMTLASFSGMLWGMGPLMGVSHGMFWLAAGYAGALTALTVGAGRKLPWIQRNQQWREADFRDSITAVHNNADMVALNDSEGVEKELIKKRFKPVMKNSVREIGTQVKLIVVDATAGNLSIPIPYIVGAFGVAAGTASMGTVQTLNYAFNRVTNSMSFIVNRFEQLSQMKATADRIYLMDQAIDASHYIEAEKKEAFAAHKGALPKSQTPEQKKPSGPAAPK